MQYVQTHAAGVCSGPALSRRVQLRWPKPAMDAKRQHGNSAQVLRDWIASTAPRVQSGLNSRLAVQVFLTLALTSQDSRADHAS